MVGRKDVDSAQEENRSNGQKQGRKPSREGSYFVVSGPSVIHGGKAEEAREEATRSAATREEEPGRLPR